MDVWCFAFAAGRYRAVRRTDENCACSRLYCRQTDAHSDPYCLLYGWMAWDVVTRKFVEGVDVDGGRGGSYYKMDVHVHAWGVAFLRSDLTRSPVKLVGRPCIH